MPGADPLILVAGNIASGKSTLAAGLAARLELPLAEEKWGDNPFFDKYYADPARWALHTHLFFLTSSAEAYARAARSGRGAVIDRGPQEMDAIFGDALVETGFLDSTAGDVCHSLTALILEPLPAPDLLVVVDASVAVLLERAAARGRTGEHLDEKYVALLQRYYVRFAERWRASPVLRVDSEVHDFRDRAITDEIAARVAVLAGAAS